MIDPIQKPPAPLSPESARELCCTSTMSQTFPHIETVLHIRLIDSLKYQAFTDATPRNFFRFPGRSTHAGIHRIQLLIVTDGIENRLGS